MKKIAIIILMSACVFLFSGCSITEDFKINRNSESEDTKGYFDSKILYDTFSNTASAILCRDDGNGDKAINKEAVSSLSDDISLNLLYTVLDVRETRNSGDLIVSFVLEDVNHYRYFISYNFSYIDDEISNEMLKIIPGDTVSYSEETRILTPMYQFGIID